MAYVLSSKAVKTLRDLVRGSSASTTSTYSAAAINYDTYRPPFSVQWSSDQNGGQGAWEIFLPDLAKVLMVDADYITPTGITAAQNEPDGWYTIDDLEKSDEELWLVITLPTEESSTATVTAEFANEDDDDDNKISILIATMEVDSESEIKWVKQFVDSAITLTTGGGDSVTTDDHSTEIYQYSGQGTPTAAEQAAEGKLQIKDWHSGTNAGTVERTHSLGEILAGAEDQAASTTGEKTIVRPTPADGQIIPDLAYRVVGTIPFDNASIEGFNDGSQRKVQIKGYAGASTNTVPTKTANGLVWQIPAGGADISAMNGISFVTNVEWVGSPYYVIRIHKRTATVTNGVLTFGNEFVANNIQTTPITDATS